MTGNADYGAGCWQCGAPAAGEIPTGPPEHKWRWWCLACLRAENARLRTLLDANDGARS